jgi:hypothetical protein
MSKKASKTFAPASEAPRAPAKTPRPPVDWDAIEPHYRAGTRSLASLGAEFSVSDAAIIKHAKKHGWTRNLLGKVQAAADAKVRRAMVSAEVSAAVSAKKQVSEALTIEVEAEVQARIRLAHRRDVGRARSLAMALLMELEHQTTDGPLYEALSALLDSQTEDRAGKLQSAMDRALSLGNRTSTMKALSDAMKTLIALEREAYALDAVAPAEKQDFPEQLAQFMRQIHETGAGRLPIVPRRPT